MLGTSSRGAGRLAIGLALGVVLGLSTVGGVAVGQAVYDANNAHKVDGKHAVGAGASKSARAGKLVATNGQGQFPAGAVPRFESFASAFGESATSTTSTTAVALTGASTTIKMARAGVIQATFSAESACYGAPGWCTVDVLVDGAKMDGDPSNGDDAFDSSDNDTETFSSWEARSLTHTLAVAKGTHTVEVKYYTTNGATFRLDDWNLVVEGHM